MRDKILTTLIPMIILIFLPTAMIAAPVVLELQQGLNGYDGCQDAHIFPDANYAGNIIDLSVGGAGQFGFPNLVLIRFNGIKEALGETRILHAELRLFLKEEETPTPVKISTYRVLQNWNEEFLEKNGVKGWTQFDEGKNWNGDGLSEASDTASEDGTADRNATPISTASVDAGVGRWYAWDLTEAVRNWHEGKWKNYGILLMGEVKGLSLKSFAASEDAAQLNRPKLVITHMPPELIESVLSYDLANAADNDGVYRPGQVVAISISAHNKQTGLVGTIRIRSVGTIPGVPGGYDTGERLLEDRGNGIYEYMWYTDGLSEGRYQVTARLFDPSSKRESINSSLTIQLDATPPVPVSASIDSAAKLVTTRSVTLTLSAKEATWVFISGDLSPTDTVMKWIPYIQTIPITLFPGDGMKVVRIKFMDDASNESDEIELKVQLDEMPPAIESVSSYDVDDPTDSDGFYRPGQKIMVVVRTKDKEKGLTGTIRISGVGYNTGEQAIKDEGDGRYSYLWQSGGAPDGEYTVFVTLTDTLGRSTTNSDYRITLNSKGPANPKVVILNVGQFVTSRDLMLALQAEGATEMFVSGDVADDANTFQWIPYREKLLVTLTEGDGLKRITVRYKDATNSESQAATSVTLETTPPSLLGFGTLAVKEDGSATMTLFFSEEISSVNPPTFSLSLESLTDPNKIASIGGPDVKVSADGNRVYVELPSSFVDELRETGAISGRSMILNLTLAPDSVRDRAGNGNSQTRVERFKLDLVNPSVLSKVELSSSFVSPNGDGVNDTLSFSYTLAESGKVVMRVLDEKGETLFESESPSRLVGVRYDGSWDLKIGGVPLDDGVYSLILLLDKDGEPKQIVPKPFQFTVDTVPPRISSILPTDGSRIPGSVSVSVEGEDENGIAKAFLLIDFDPQSRIELKLDKNGRFVTSSPLSLASGRRSLEIHMVDQAGNESVSSVTYNITTSTKPIISLFSYPNPFRAGDSTRIALTLGVTAEEAEVMIYDPAGRLVFRKKFEGEPGEHLIEWDGRDLQGNPLPRGIYFCRAVAAGEVRIYKIGIK
jgi:hypothetical protein